MKAEQMKVTIIKDPPKSWWPGDPRVEKFMLPVDGAIKRHIKWPSDAFTDIYNRCYEAVYNAIKEYAKTEPELVETAKSLTPLMDKARRLLRGS